MVVYAATRLVDVPEFRRFARFRRSELVLALGTTAAVLVLGVLPGSSLPSPCPSSTCCVEWPVRTTRSVPCRGWPGMHDIDDYP